jgi:ketosteroid isomerase-like protein
MYDRRMLAALLAIAALQSASADANLASLQKQLRADDQALLDAIAPGDKAVWDRLLAPDAIYVDENGAVMNRAQFLAALKPLPAGSSGHITILEYQATLHGQVALVVHKDDERENYHGIPLQANYLMTETWVKDGSDWHLALVHVYVVAKDPPAIKTPPNLLAEYEGRYRAAPDLSYVIRREGDHLVGERQGLSSVTLSQESTDVFFVAGHPRDRKIFRRGAGNKIVDFVDRREGEDLVFVRGE